MNLLKLTVVGLTLLLASCNTTKDATKNSATTSEKTTMNKEEAMAMDAKFIDQGYTIGTVKLTDKACSVILEVEKTGAKFDPINIDDEKFSMYKKQDEVLYFKFRGLRMLNRCEEAQPIELTDIKKREN